jgi:hypothetical protein
MIISMLIASMVIYVCLMLVVIFPKKAVRVLDKVLGG